MKKAFLLICCVLLLSSCANSSEIYEDNHDTVQEIEMPEPFNRLEASGGDSLHDYYSKYTLRFGNINSTISGLVDPEKDREWSEKHFADKIADPDTPEMTVLEYIEYFNIPKEKLVEAVSNADFPEGWIISLSDIDIIYSGDDDLINKTFVNEYALLYNGKIYTPEWLYEHSVSDYLNEGLPIDEIKAYLTKMGDFPFTEEAKKALSAKSAAAEARYSNYPSDF